MTRIAPTPSGYLHPGNAANFAACALLAEREDIPLLLRIDDLDRGRVREAYLQDIFDTLDWLGIQWTMGPTDVADFQQHWSQNHRMGLYAEALHQLRTCVPAQIFACPCSRKDLADGTHAHDCLSRKTSLDRPGVAWRIDTRGLDIHHRMPDFAVKKKDGRPSYQLACTVDDHHFGITHCVRGEDLRDSTLAQSLLSDLLGYRPLHERMTVLHHPLLTTDGRKLSKTQGDTSVRMSGWTPARLFDQARQWLGTGG
jgi:glutamyl/glutaminyl-tRNA synthetase